MNIGNLARYAMVGALAVSLACARNSEETETGATGSVRTADTGATVRVRPEADTAGTEIIGDTSRGTRTDLDSTAGSGAPVRPTATDSARMTIDTAPTTGGPSDSASMAPGAGWPEDGGWSTPPDSGR